jgi:hypothetical protein
LQHLQQKKLQTTAPLPFESEAPAVEVSLQQRLQQRLQREEVLSLSAAVWLQQRRQQRRQLESSSDSALTLSVKQRLRQEGLHILQVMGYHAPLASV